MTAPIPLEILIAEDSATQSLLLQSLLEGQGFRVTAARNGRLAWEALAGFHPALVITDIQMPEMDGYELCACIKRDPRLREIPVMLLTSLTAPEDVIRGLECGADNFVVKPFDRDLLLSRVGAVLDERGQAESGAAIPVQVANHRYLISAGRRQILNLLLSTYEAAIQTNRELIETHERLRSAQAQLIEAGKLQSVGRLAAGVAHEVRNPLAIMEMAASFLETEPLGDDARLMLREMKEAVARASTVITSLTDLAAPRELGMNEGDLHAVIEHALSALRDKFAEHGITVSRHFASDLPPSRFASDKLEQVFCNVFTNAIDAMPEGGVLTVRTSLKTFTVAELEFEPGERGGARFRQGEEAIVVDVQDTGRGISSADAGKLFEPFFTTKPTGQGMGLGLTVAKKFVDLHRGKIEIANAENGGAIVSLTFKTA